MPVTISAYPLLALSSREDAHPDPNRYTSFPADKPFCVNDTDAAWIIDADGEEARTMSPSSARISRRSRSAAEPACLHRSRRQRRRVRPALDIAPSLARGRFIVGVLRDGAQLLRRRVAPVTFLAVTAVLAEFADSADGRHCAVTNRVVALRANCSERTVSTVRSVLAAAEFALLAKQGSAAAAGRTELPSGTLVSRRQPVDNSGVCVLPPSRRDRGSSLVGRNKPTRTREENSLAIQETTGHLPPNNGHLPCNAWPRSWSVACTE